jgi:short-subunit dehydrogenase
MKLKGKTVLLTGASKGLGRALAIQLDAQGCRLLLIARDADKLDSLLKVLHTPGSRPFPCDLSDKDARSRLIDEISNSESRLDLLLLNAGIGSHSRLDQLSAAEIREVLQLNTVAPLELTASFLHLLPAGEPAGIVSIGSLAGDLDMPGMSLYSASKAALHAFSRAADIEFAANEYFSLLVILGAISGTNFGDGIRHPTDGQPGWYRRLDVDVDQAAARIIKAIQQQRSQLLIPTWYTPLLALSKLFAPLTRAAKRLAYQQFQSTGK